MPHPASSPRPLLLAAAGLLLLPAVRAGAQELFDAPSPTRGVMIPNGAVAGDADATTLETNPGQLGLVDSVSTALVADLWEDGVTREGRGAGLFYASPLLRGVSLGASLQWLHPSLVAQPSDYGKFSLGTGFRLGRGLGLGVLWEHLFRSRYAGTDSFAAGIGWRPHTVLAVGLAGYDLFRPRAEPGGARIPRELDFEVAVRPLGTPRLELAGGLRALQSGGDAGVSDKTSVWPRGRFTVGLLEGLSLFGEFDSPRARLAAIDASGTRTPETEYRALLGLSGSLDRLVLGAAAVANVHSESAGDSLDRGPGASLVLQSFSSRRPALVDFSYIARVRMQGLENDRSFIEMVVGLRRLGDDPTVDALLVQLDHLDLGYGRIEELRGVLADINQTKPVFFWLAQPSTGEYYLASAGTAVALHPAGDLFLAGLSSTLTFFKNTLDQLGVAVELVRIAEYKGAMEPFVFTESSGPVRENRNALMDDLFARLKDGIARSRAGKGIDGARIGQLFDRGLFSAAEAKDLGLVDELADERQMEKFVEKRLGRRLAIRDADWARRETGRWRPKRVAVILVDGAITDGRPGGLPSPVQGAVAWSDPILDALEAVRRDPSVGSVVLRVNSPGGSAFASDRIAREIVRLREAKKPVVVSMGDTAASGGYYIAAPGDTIIASPSAVTGSIGIYAFKLDLANLIGKVGIRTETFTRGARADLYSLYRPWRPDERAVVNDRITTHYQQFLKTVASGRKDRGIDEKRANDLGRGRVYTGSQALTLGLVDRLGGIGAAIDEAARRGGVPTGSGGLPEVVLLPNAPNDPLETLLALRRFVKVDAQDDADGPSPAAELDAGTASTVATFIARHGRPAARLLLPLLLGPPDAIQARLPYELEIR